MDRIYGSDRGEWEVQGARNVRFNFMKIADKSFSIREYMYRHHDDRECTQTGIHGVKSTVSGGARWMSDKPTSLRKHGTCLHQYLSDGIWFRVLYFLKN